MISMLGPAITAVWAEEECGGMSGEQKFCLAGEQNQHLLTPGYTLTTQVQLIISQCINT